MFHTQEKRAVLLTGPIMCIKSNAWLGEAFYFWQETQDAKMWGEKFKRRTGYFDIYKAEIDCENVLDTVFNESHYHFWREQIEKVGKVLTKKLKRRPTLKEINQYFRDRATWDDVTGILFQDIPTSTSSTLITEFYYRKRIQLAVYRVEIIHTFVHVYTGTCR